MAKTVCSTQSGGSAWGSYTSIAVPGTALPAFAPAVPLSLTPVSNPSTVTMTVVITGGTMSAVVVNGITVGAGAGTYTVPPLGSIVMTYSAAPTWSWSYVPTFTAAVNSDGSPGHQTGHSK